MRNFQTRFFVLSIVAFGSLFAGQDEYIEWRPIPGSSGYQIQVREQKSLKILIDQFIEATTLDVDLKIGQYQNRTAPLSPFGKPIVWSDWRPLRILVARAPSVENPTKVEISERKPFNVHLKGENFTQSILVYLVGSNGKYQAVSTQASADGTDLSFRMDPATIPPGSYAILLQNPRNKTWNGDDLVALKYSAQAVAVKDNAKDHTKVKTETADYRDSLKSMPSTCKNSGLPDTLVLKCFKSHVVMDLSTPEKVELFNYLEAYQGNYQDRLRGYTHFREQCGALSPQVKTILTERLRDSGNTLDNTEKDQIQETLIKLNECPAKNS